MDLVLTEKCEDINNQLMDDYGIDTITGMGMFRVVFGPEQLEFRHDTFQDFSPSGLFIRAIKETRLVPKYTFGPVYVLERLVIIPECNQGDLPATKLSYEPLYSFLRNADFHPPSIGAVRFIIDSVLAAQGKDTLAKYKDPESGLTPTQLYEKRQAEIDAIQKELFSDETEVGDALAMGEAIVVPRNYGDN